MSRQELHHLVEQAEAYIEAARRSMDENRPAMNSMLLMQMATTIQVQALVAMTEMMMTDDGRFRVMRS